MDDLNERLSNIFPEPEETENLEDAVKEAVDTIENWEEELPKEFKEATGVILRTRFQEEEKEEDLEDELKSTLEDIKETLDSHGEVLNGLSESIDGLTEEEKEEDEEEDEEEKDEEEQDEEEEKEEEDDEKESNEIPEDLADPLVKVITETVQNVIEGDN